MDERFGHISDRIFYFLNNALPYPPGSFIISKELSLDIRLLTSKLLARLKEKNETIRRQRKELARLNKRIQDFMLGSKQPKRDDFEERLFSCVHCGRNKVELVHKKHRYQIRCQGCMVNGPIEIKEEKAIIGFLSREKTIDVLEG